MCFIIFIPITIKHHFKSHQKKIMDPNLFHLDYSRLVEVLVTIVVFSFLIERGLSVIFESRFFIIIIEGNDIEQRKIVNPIKIKRRDYSFYREYSYKTYLKLVAPYVLLKFARKVIEAFRGSLKETLAIAVSVICCFTWHFDAPTIILASNDETTTLGTIITGAIIAGGSKASIKLFRDILGFMSSAEKKRRSIN